MPVSAAVPTTADYLRFHAEHQPGAIALIDGDRKIDYATFHADVGRFTRALKSLGLPQDISVAVARESFYLHWLMLLACENLGWATASFLPTEEESLSQLLRHVGLVLSSRKPPPAVGVRWHPVTKEWVVGVSSSPTPGEDLPAVAMGPDDPLRIRRSSGTTGGFKMMVATRRIEELWIERNVLLMGFAPGSTFLVTAPFTVGSIYSRATACLRLGGTCIGSGTDLASDIVRCRPSHLWLFPFQMKDVLDALPDDFRSSSDLTLMIGSAPISATLWKRLTDRLATRIIYLYSSNEAGTIASVSPEGICSVRPGVQFEIVDSRGVATPPGQVGELKVRTQAMVNGYLDEAVLTQQKFRDGWFHTGDAASALVPGQFRLEGRTDNSLNIGGRKFMPEQFEDLMARQAAFADVGVTSVVGVGGAEEICIAIVMKDNAPFEENRDHVVNCLPPSPGTVRISVVKRIPRAPGTGKIRRAELKKLFMPG